MAHSITRLRQELKQRQVMVKETIRLTPNMLRIVFTGDDLADFESPAPDNHVKLFFPMPNGDIEKRDYTPRAFNNAARTLTIDFALHEGQHKTGPATAWAKNAKPGDMLQIGGPRGSTIISPSFDWWLLIGDETALPAIARRLAELPPGTKVKAIISVTDQANEQQFETQSHCEITWLHRPTDQAADPTPLLRLLETIELPKGEGFIWIATEGLVARAVRDYLVNTRAHLLAWTKSSGYWLKGLSGVHDKG